jgi:hypothetical protein
MTFQTCAVTCRLITQDGSALSGVTVSATLSRTVAGNGFLVPTLVSAVTDVDGLAILDLWPNALDANPSYYRIKMEVTGRNPSYARAFVPDLETVELHEIATMYATGAAAQPAATIAGAQGEVGARGAQGVMGIQGIQGIEGPIGRAGPRGVAGPRGTQGDRGMQGASGPTGPMGQVLTVNGTVVTGPQGQQGERGERGDTGNQGDQGYEGPRGEQGERGIQGIQGIRGQQGIQGLQGRVIKVGGGVVTGPKGDKGDAGETGADTAAALEEITVQMESIQQVLDMILGGSGSGPERVMQ